MNDLEGKSPAQFAGGFVRDRGEGRGVRASVPKVQDLTVTHQPVPVNVNKLAQERKTRLATLGIPSSVLEVGSPAYKRCVKLASAYKRTRIKEFLGLHGQVSSGVHALLSAASLALAASRFLYETAATMEISPERGQLGMAGTLKLASSLSDSARQNELSAWELAAREAIVRAKMDAAKAQMPWLVSSSDSNSPNPSLNGPPMKRGRGRPRKDANMTKTVEINPTVIGGYDAGNMGPTGSSS